MENCDYDDDGGEKHGSRYMMNNDQSVQMLLLHRQTDRQTDRQTYTHTRARARARAHKTIFYKSVPAQCYNAQTLQPNTNALP